MVLSEPLERSGFRLTRKVFTSPQNAASLDPVTKRKITICNLFVNHRLRVADIVRVLDEDYKHIVASSRDLSMSDARTLEKVLRRS